jgi:hypothetical protein
MKAHLNAKRLNATGLAKANVTLAALSVYERIEQYIETNSLPRNPLFYQGYGSLGDRHLTTTGSDRSGREVMECGLHVTGGKAVTRSGVKHGSI